MEALSPLRTTFPSKQRGQLGAGVNSMMQTRPTTSGQEASQTRSIANTGPTSIAVIGGKLPSVCIRSPYLGRPPLDTS